jgi:hypothetical protein
MVTGSVRVKGNLCREVGRHSVVYKKTGSFVGGTAPDEYSCPVSRPGVADRIPISMYFVD